MTAPTKQHQYQFNQQADQAVNGTAGKYLPCAVSASACVFPT
jgi:hypothetical protein